MTKCTDNQDYLSDKDSRFLIIEEISLDYDDRIDKLAPDRHTLPYLQFDSFCKPTLKHPLTIVWFPEEYCLLIHISDYIGRMSKLSIRCWLKIDDFFNTTGKDIEEFIKAYCQLYCLIPFPHW